MSKERQRAGKEMEIRRYSNRRFYDTTHSRHVTLEDIHNRVKDGWQIRVTDASTGEDITARVLTQLLMELDEAKLSAFPPELLHRIIRANESLIGDFVENYFNRALELFLNSRRQFDEQVRRSMGFAPPVSPAEWFTRAWSAAPFGPAGEQDHAPSPKNPAMEEASPDLQQRVEELNREMEAMRVELARLKPAKRKRASARRSAKT